MYKVMFCVSRLDVNHYFELSCFSFVFQFVFQLRRTSDDAPRSPIFSASRRPPPSITSESRDEESGLVTLDLSPRLARIVSEDLARCSRYVAQVKRSGSIIVQW